MFGITFATISYGGMINRVKRKYPYSKNPVKIYTKKTSPYKKLT